MKVPEAMELLRLISAADGRTVTDDIALIWAGILDDVLLADAVEAVRQHLRNHPDKRIMPGHVHAGAVRIAQARADAERAAMPKITPWGYPEGDPRNDDALRAWKAAQENAQAPALSPVRVVDSPALAWERDRRIPKEVLARAESPLITDLTRIEEIERARRRYLAALKSMMEHPTRDEEAAQDHEASDPGTAP